MSTHTHPDQSNNRLCIIGEADPFLSNLLRRFSEKSGLRVRRAQTGEAVVELVQFEKPALVILEPDLPGRLRGWQVAADQSMEDIPLLICTWLSELEARALVKQAFIYLQKPDLHYSGFIAALEAAGIQQPSPGQDQPLSAGRRP